MIVTEKNVSMNSLYANKGDFDWGQAASTAEQVISIIDDLIKNQKNDTPAPAPAQTMPQPQNQNPNNTPMYFLGVAVFVLILILYLKK